MLSPITLSILFLVPTLILAKAHYKPVRAPSRPIPFKPDDTNPEPHHSSVKECPAGQVGFCIASPRNKSCSLACDKTCDAKCPEGSQAVVLDCKTVCIKMAKKAKDGNACGEGFDQFVYAQETSTPLPTTRCECPTMAQAIGDASESDSDEDMSSSDSYSSDESDYSDSSDNSDSFSSSEESSDSDSHYYYRSRRHYSD